MALTAWTAVLTRPANGETAAGVALICCPLVFLVRLVNHLIDGESSAAGGRAKGGPEGEPGLRGLPAHRRARIRGAAHARDRERGGGEHRDPPLLLPDQGGTRSGGGRARLHPVPLDADAGRHGDRSAAPALRRPAAPL